jgi:spermidine synthase
MLSWVIDSTAVELVPSVPELVTFFHPNAAALMMSPLSHVVIDDGRFYLERSSAQYDVITIDPPPPVEAAGSSLLYSKEFYSTVRQHHRSHARSRNLSPMFESSVRWRVGDFIFWPA